MYFLSPYVTVPRDRDLRDARRAIDYSVDLLL